MHRGPFFERPRNFLGPKANFKIRICWIVAQFLAHKPVNFPSLTDSFIISFSKLLEPWSWMQTRNSFLGPKSYQDFSETGPWSVVYLSMSNIRATKTTNYNRGNTINGKPVVFIVTQKAENFNWPEANLLCTSMTEELKSGLPRTNPVSSYREDWTHALCVTISVL